jgi:hypothetical protein
MRKTIACLTCLFVLGMVRTSYGLAEEHIGPDSVAGHPTVAQPGWPVGIEAVPRHPSRVYSIWVNGNENFYFQATPADVNELVTLFSRVRMRDHEVVIAAARPAVKTFKGDPVDFNVSLQIVAGIALFMTRERESTTDLPLEPRLTIYAGHDRTLVEKVIWPKNLIIRNDVPGLNVPSGVAKPQRKVYYGKLEFADGSPPVGFVMGVNSRITLWEQQAVDGIEVGSVNNKGYFTILLSEHEMADLRAGKIWLTATIGNYLTKARKTDLRIPVDRLTRDKDQAQAIPVAVPGSYHGRILFEDGTPPILDPAPWPGAEIWADFPFAGMAHLDAQGYFKVVLTPEQLEQLRARKVRNNIYIPSYTEKGSSRGAATYPPELLSAEKEKAGVVRIPKPQAPRRELSQAESKLGKPIPGFEKVRFEAFQIDQIKDKPLVVCFWDVDQRPARQCVQALEKQKDALQKKGFVVLVIHCGPQPREQMQHWLRENKISLPVGMVEGDPYDVLWAWGAKGTPWLVLTDERHIVTKEGFGLDEFLAGR